MHLAICDDEPDQIARIASALEAYRAEKLPSLRWDAFQSGFSLLSAIEQGSDFDAILLDIFLTDTNGMDVAHSIRTMNDSIGLVFLTSSADYAVESYTVEACDYVLKPVTQSMLFRTLDKLAGRVQEEIHQGIVVRSVEGNLVKIEWRQLMYLEAMRHIVVFYHADGTSTKARLPFTSFVEKLSDQENFVQTHRSFIVNLHYVHRIEKNRVFLLNGAELPLPRSRYRKVSDDFQNLLFEEIV